MSAIISKNELATYRDDEQILADTRRQIDKDFEQFGLEIPTDIEGQNPFMNLFNNLRPVVEYLVEKNAQKLAQVIYRVDLNESRVAEALDNQSDNNPVDELTTLIIERELTKVLLRRKFS